MWDLLSPKEKILLLRKDNDGEFWYMMQGLRTHVAYIRTSIQQTFMGCLIYARQRRQWHPTPVLLPGKSHAWTEETRRLQSMGSLRVRHD